MPSDGFAEGAVLGASLGNSIAQGVAEWRQIQLEKRQQKEFEAGIGLYNQRTLSARQGMDGQTAQQLSSYENQVKRYPDAQIVQRPTGGVDDSGAAELESVIRTPEGDIPIAQVQQLRARKRQTDGQMVMADIDALMELQSRYPDNPKIKQFVASTYQGIQAKQEIQYRQFQQQLVTMERAQAQQQLALDQQKLQEQKRQFDLAPQRQQAQEKVQTDEGIRRDTARIAAQKQADLEVEGVKAGTKTGPQPTEYQRKLALLAPRAEEALQVLDSLDYDRTTATAGVESMLPNAFKGAKRQKLEQAQLQFVDAVLRAESGATVTKDEVARNIPKYFPQYGDDPEVVAQKKQARETAAAGLREQAAGGAPVPSRQPPGGLSPQEQQLIDAVKAGQMTPDEARARRAQLRAR
jgi:hypothetical protein